MRKAVLTWTLALCASASLTLVSTSARAQGGQGGAPAPANPGGATPPPAAAPAPAAPPPTTPVIPGATVTTSPPPPAAAPAAAGSTAAAPAPTGAAPSTSAAGSGWVTLHVDSPSPVSVEKRADANAAWEHVCESPCDQHVPVEAEYRITGTDVNESKPFSLHARGDTATIKVTPGSPGKARTGWIILGSGGAVALAGIIVDGVGASRGSIAGADGTTTDNSRTDFMFVGTTMIIVGVLGGIYGGSMVLDNQHSAVEGAVMEPPPARGSNDPVTRTAQASLASVPRFVVPVVTLKF